MRQRNVACGWHSVQSMLVAHMLAACYLNDHFSCEVGPLFVPKSLRNDHVSFESWLHFLSKKWNRGTSFPAMSLDCHWPSLTAMKLNTGGEEGEGRESIFLGSRLSHPQRHSCPMPAKVFPSYLSQCDREIVLPADKSILSDVSYNSLLLSICWKNRSRFR